MLIVWCGIMIRNAVFDCFSQLTVNCDLFPVAEKNELKIDNRNKMIVTT
jgi:hypothetical protein